MTRSGAVTTLAGSSGLYGSTDGIGGAARFNNPNGVAVDSAGNLYVADFYFNTIRKGFPATTILNSGFNLGQFRFDLTGPTGHLLVIEASTDLVNWLPLWTNTFGGSALSFSDPKSGISSIRFYRAHVLHGIRRYGPAGRRGYPWARAPPSADLSSLRPHTDPGADRTRTSRSKSRYFFPIL